MTTTAKTYELYRLLNMRDKVIKQEQELATLRATNAKLLEACRLALKASRDGVIRSIWATDMEQAIAKAEREGSK